MNEKVFNIQARCQIINWRLGGGIFTSAGAWAWCQTIQMNPDANEIGANTSTPQLYDCLILIHIVSLVFGMWQRAHLISNQHLLLYHLPWTRNFKLFKRNTRSQWRSIIEHDGIWSMQLISSGQKLSSAKSFSSKNRARTVLPPKYLPFKSAKAWRQTDWRHDFCASTALGVPIGRNHNVQRNL